MYTVYEVFGVRMPAWEEGPIMPLDGWTSLPSQEIKETLSVVSEVEIIEGDPKTET